MGQDGKEPVVDQEGGTREGKEEPDGTRPVVDQEEPDGTREGKT